MGHEISSRGKAGRNWSTLGVAMCLTVMSFCLLAAASPAAQASGWLQVAVVDQASQKPVIGETVEVAEWNADAAACPLVATWLSEAVPYTREVPAGKYQVLVMDRCGAYASQFWNCRLTRTRADVLTVSDGQTTTCVVGLGPAGHIVGRVADSAHTPLPGVYVTVQGIDPNEMEFGGQVSTDANGHYDIGGLAAGRYTIEAQDLSLKFLYQFYPDQLSHETAMIFDVVAGQTVQAPAIVMKHAATIDGGITTHLGIVPHDVDCAVEARGPDGSWMQVFGSCCYNDCTYRLAQIPAGRYRISYSWNGHPVNRQYYPGTFDASKAKIFDISEGEHLSGLDMVMWGDTEAPTTQAPLADLARRGDTADLTYRVIDAKRHGPTADVTIKVKTRAGKTVKVVHLAKRPVNKLRHLHFACNLPKGSYRYFVYAVDCGGNHQRRIGTNTLTVK